MSRENDVTALLQQYTAETGVRSVQRVEQDFAEVVQQVPVDAVTNGLSAALRSEQTPPFDEVLGQSFEQGDSEQRAGMLNQLIGAAGNAAVRPLVESGVLEASLTKDGQQGTLVHPELAGQVQPELVQQMAREAEQDNPEVIDKMSSFYAEDTALVKTLGGATLSVALGKIAESR